MRIGSEKGWTVVTHPHFYLYIFALLFTALCFRGWLRSTVAPDMFAMWLPFGCLPHLWFISINCPFTEFSLIKLFDVLFAAYTLTEGKKSLKYNMDVLDLLDFPVCNLHCIRRQEAWSQVLFSPLKSLSVPLFCFLLAMAPMMWFAHLHPRHVMVAGQQGPVGIWTFLPFWEQQWQGIILWETGLISQKGGGHTIF